MLVWSCKTWTVHDQFHYCRMILVYWRFQECPGLSIDLSWSFVSSLLWVIVSLIDTHFYQKGKLNSYNNFLRRIMVKSPYNCVIFPLTQPQVADQQQQQNIGNGCVNFGYQGLHTLITFPTVWLHYDGNRCTVIHFMGSRKWHINVFCYLKNKYKRHKLFLSIKKQSKEQKRTRPMWL